MTREIGSTFEYQENTYKVIEDTFDDICNKCAFCNIDCDSIEKISGRCTSPFRTDNTDVHFELINTDDNEHQLYVLENNMNLNNE